MNKYVVSLNTEGRRDKRIEELRRTLTEMADVKILEGGRYAFTVYATVSAVEFLRPRLRYAHIEPHRTLKLLAVD